MDEKTIGATSKTLLPYIITVAGSVIGVAGSFVKYITASNAIFSWKMSIFQMIVESIDKPEVNLSGVGDKIIFGIIVAGVAFSVLSILFALLKKMKSAIVFAVLAFLPFLMLEKAWIHYIGFALTIIGAIWYLVAKKKNPSSI